MKNKILLFICASLFATCSSTYAQVYNGDLTFSNQTDIDNFSTAPYTSVNGKLEVRDDLDGVHDIRNLAGLAGLTSVTGFVAIRFNNVLLNTAFLNLQSIGSGMSISSNPGVTNINGMGSLVSVAGQIDIQNNEFLTTVSAFGNLPAVGGLVIQQNTRLTNLGGFSNLSVITGSMIIGDNINLTGLSGFANLTTVTLSMIIRNNPSLGSLSGLVSLRRVGILNIQNNVSLINLDGSPSRKSRAQLWRLVWQRHVFVFRHQFFDIRERVAHRLKFPRHAILRELHRAALALQHSASASDQKRKSPCLLNLLHALKKKRVAAVIELRKSGDRRLGIGDDFGVNGDEISLLRKLREVR